MKVRHLLMTAGVAIAAWLAMFGDKTPNGVVAEPVVRQNGKPGSVPRATVNTAQAAPMVAPAAIDNTARNGKPKPEPVILALHAREELIGGRAAGNEANALFGSQSWVPPPLPPPKPVAPPPPSAPALPYTFLGKKLEDATWEVYLANGEHTFIARQKNVLENTYRIESIKPPILTLTYLPLNQMQTLPIGGTD